LLIELGLLDPDAPISKYSRRFRLDRRKLMFETVDRVLYQFDKAKNGKWKGE
jgi:hypothetical protein